MSEPVTSAWAQYAGFWTPLAMGAGVFGLVVIGLLVWIGLSVAAIRQGLMQ